jgi:hypothetical protein
MPAGRINFKSGLGMAGPMTAATAATRLAAKNSKSAGSGKATTAKNQRVVPEGADAAFADAFGLKPAARKTASKTPPTARGRKRV